MYLHVYLIKYHCLYFLCHYYLVLCVIIYEAYFYIHYNNYYDYKKGKKIIFEGILIRRNLICSVYLKVACVSS